MLQTRKNIENEINNLLLSKSNDESYIEIKRRMSIKKEVVKWLSKQHIKYHLTITFPKFTDEVWTRRLLNTFIRNLNRAIYKKRFSENKSCLKGFVIRERSAKMMTDHYHILLSDHGWLPTADKMEHLIDKQVKFLKTDLKTGQKKKYYIQDCLLQNYYNHGDDGLENYVSKQFEFLLIDIQKIKDSIGLLGFGEVAFGRDQFTTHH